jgi:hypothetical protein
MPPITIDKSFAHAAPASVLAELAAHWVFMVPSAFYWEILTTAPIKRVRTVEGMPEFRRVDLLSLRREEMKTGEPVIAVNTPRLQISDDLRAAAWSPNAEHSSLLDQYKKKSLEPVLIFWNKVISKKGVPGFSSDELVDVTASEAAFVKLCEELKDDNRIRKIAFEMDFLHAAKIDRRWVHFRLFQAWALHGLVLLRRYRDLRGGVPSETRFEHDVQDIDYLILGLHTGALATGDDSQKLAKASLAWRFTLLKPRGVLKLLSRQQTQSRKAE